MNGTISHHWRTHRRDPPEMKPGAAIEPVIGHVKSDIGHGLSDEMERMSTKMSSPKIDARRPSNSWTHFLPNIRRRVPRIIGRLLLRGSPPKKQKPKSLDNADQSSLSNSELLAFVRHDAHRIEKAFYNRIFFSKMSYYAQRRQNVRTAIELLRERGFDLAEPTVAWACRIADTFERLEEQFIRPESTKPQPIDIDAAQPFLSLVASRRSSRVWSHDQPPIQVLEIFARRMIDAARWAPNSGNRQSWRFKIITADQDKLLLKGLKEEHCYTAPCLIFVGSDKRVYGALGKDEAGIHIDAGAAIMQMVLLAHASHFGVCWNHFSRDLIESRERNRQIYSDFAAHVGIPHYIEPIAILAIGAAAFHPPVPPRMDVESLLL